MQYVSRIAYLTPSFNVWCEACIGIVLEPPLMKNAGLNLIGLKDGNSKIQRSKRGSIPVRCKAMLGASLSSRFSMAAPMIFDYFGPSSFTASYLGLRNVLGEADSHYPYSMGAARRTPEGDRLDVLATLVEAYERKHFPLDAPDPIEAIKFVMEQRGLTVKDLEPAIGKSNRVYEVLAHKRPLTLRMIQGLHSLIGIPAESLIKRSA